MLHYSLKGRRLLGATKIPLSRPDTYPRVINYIWENNPQSILDCGIGFGGMGVLLRQVSDVRWGRVKPYTWKIKIDGIEINSEYRQYSWGVYNEVFIGDLKETLPKCRKYDVIFFGDVLEHFEKEDAIKLIEISLQKANKSVIITTPASFSGNEAEAERFDNPKEQHLCLLEDSDFPEGAIIEQYGGQKIIIIEK